MRKKFFGKTQTAFSIMIGGRYPGCKADEVWFEMKESLLPKERRKEFIPREKDVIENQVY